MRPAPPWAVGTVRSWNRRSRSIVSTKAPSASRTSRWKPTGEEDQEVFLLHAGVSVERLAKAALALVHPTLLTEVNGKDDMLLHFAGAVSKPPVRLRTIGASTAIGRLRKMDVLPQKPSSEADDLDGLIELRRESWPTDA